MYYEVLNDLSRKFKECYWSDYFDAWYYRKRVLETKASQLYKDEVRKIHKMPLHYSDFLTYMKGERGYYSLGLEERPPIKKKRRWNSRRQPDYKNGPWINWQFKTGFVKKPHHKKKILTEDQVRKREWRKKIKDPRDQVRHGYRRGGRLLQESHRGVRIKWKQRLGQLNHNNYEEEWDKLVFDRPRQIWDWD